MNIVINPHPLLRKKLALVGQIDDDLRSLAQKMRETMLQAKGVGLAANQVGKDRRIFVILPELAKKHKVPEVFINPEIIEYSPQKEELEEGCLSLPQIFLSVPRAKKIKIKALDLDGRKIRFRARGFLARVLQHEIDHLNGRLITDQTVKK